MKKLFTLLLAGALCSSMAWADYSLTVYKGTSTPEAMVVTSASEWETVLATYPNAVALIDYTAANQTFANGTKNIIVKKKVNVPDSPDVTYYSYKCPNLVLTDLCNWGSKDATTAAATDFYAPHDFYATTGSYKRTLRADYNSACVPFEIKVGEFGTGELLAYTSYNQEDNDAIFSYQTAISAGVAAIIKPAVAKEWQVTFSNTKILGCPASGTAFTGVFQTTDYAGTDSYSVNTSLVNKFSPLAGNLYPFRACFKLTGSTHNAAPRLVILNADGTEETTSLDELNADVQDTKFIQNGRLMIRHNGVVYDTQGQIVK